jgi:hypothetical protein
MKKWAVGILSMAGLVALFQNCGKAGFENLEVATDVNASAVVDPKLAKLPFPYDISVNQIAHMNCPLNVRPDTMTPYFSWKVGAFQNPQDVASAALNIRDSGLRLSTEFLAEWNRTAPLFHPNVQKDKFKEALTTLPSVANSQIQISFRPRNDFRTELMRLPSGDTAPTTTILPEISSPEVVDSILANPQGPFDFFPRAEDYKTRFLEGGLIVPSAYGSDHDALRVRYDNSLLVVGFLKAMADPTAEPENILVAPSEQANAAYGKGFKPVFGDHLNPTLAPGAGRYYPSMNAMTRIEEMSLAQDTSTGVNWKCDQRFKIVRLVDRNRTMYRRDNFTIFDNDQCPTQRVTNTDYCQSPVDPRFGIRAEIFPNKRCPSNRTFVEKGHFCEERYHKICPPEPYVANPNHPEPNERDHGLYHPNYPDRPAILHALRRFLPADQWDINVSRRCIVAKNDDNACYAGSGNAPIVYDEYFFPPEQADSNYGQFMGCGVAVPGVGFLSQCASYMTLCVRN